MLIRALASDYDGTLATHGVVVPATLDALVRLKASGRKLILVTGRQLPHLQAIFPELELCDAVVAENGAVLYWPLLETEQVLAPAPPPVFVVALARRGVQPLEVGRSVVATDAGHAPAVRAALDELGLDWRLIFNKNSVMCLPRGVDKASGLAVALEALGLPASAVAGAGDAENDIRFLQVCGLAVAVSGALEAVKDIADIVTSEDAGAGVASFIDKLLDGEDDSLASIACRRQVALGGADARG